MIRNFFSRIMYGRYGSDQLNLALCIGCLVLWIISGFVKVKLAATVLNVLAYAMIIWCLFRMWSRSYDARRRENEKFLSLTAPVTKTFRQTRAQARDKDHRYFKCPTCGQVLRVPKGKGLINITCRNCGTNFQQKT